MSAYSQKETLKKKLFFAAKDAKFAKKSFRILLTPLTYILVGKTELIIGDCL